eukprot:TRINITY_DN37163_c0_g1_i1.p1 TRINITY_DN37163_c0_g1~~TRINITY_DN37163_c0_g1_i1.p1  ORF type:complete len:610 (-),score=90.28 TRINITY_DN37163_c0_g1_i1:20-1849(-)
MAAHRVMMDVKRVAVPRHLRFLLPELSHGTGFVCLSTSQIRTTMVGKSVCSGRVMERTRNSMYPFIPLGARFREALLSAGRVDVRVRGRSCASASATQSFSSSSSAEHSTTASSMPVPLSLALKSILQKDTACRSLWVLNSQSLTSQLLQDVLFRQDVEGSLQPAAVSFIDFQDLEFRNFEVVLGKIASSLSDSASAMITAKLLSSPGLVGGSGSSREAVSASVMELLVKPLLEAHPNLEDELRGYAEALVNVGEAGQEVDGTAQSASVAASALKESGSDSSRLWALLAEGWLSSSSSNSEQFLHKGSAENDVLIYVHSYLAVLCAVAQHAEFRGSPAGFIDRPTGLLLVPYLLSVLDLAATASEASALIVLLRPETLLRSMFIDARGQALLEQLVSHLQEGRTSTLRAVLETNDGSTAFWALSPPRVKGISLYQADLPTFTKPVGVVDLADHEDIAEDLSAAGSDVNLSKAEAQFEWQMDQVLSHPAVLTLRQSLSEAPTAFAVVLWETIRHICKRPHLQAPESSDDLRHPIVQAMLHTNLIKPRWGPTRLVVESDVTRQRLMKWINAHYERLTLAQRFEYNVQLIRERTEITRKLDQLTRALRPKAR